MNQDERTKNKALKLAAKQLHQQILQVRVALNVLQEQYATLKVRLVRFARKRNWSFIPARFSEAISHSELVSLYVRAGYSPAWLTPTEIRSLPEVVVAPALLEESCCCICALPFEKVAKILPCGHYFCVSCLRKWLRLRNSCPLCVRTILIQ